MPISLFVVRLFSSPACSTGGLPWEPFDSFGHLHSQKLGFDIVTSLTNTLGGKASSYVDLLVTTFFVCILI